ncbi:MULTISPECIES: ATP-binding protein [Cyanophyceae]|uniref:ATP-binding protein n=1 Tax=Cyanophyceae TaxID=3028117 RepID=UPI00168A2346|nr:ATP-binding protein [Trichocoleus sp. FACHB-69]MBD1931090.1 GAF domain-containing protein [Trichocoleus sp. FACHB-69]
MKQFQLYTLRTKLIFSFLGVALLPLLVLAFLNQRTMQKELTKNANQTLLTSASQTALSIDAFISSNLDAVRVEAQLPVLAKYLSLPANQRQSIASEVEGALRSLSRKDTLNISSYALLDRQGRAVIDTYTPDIGIDKSDRDYFERPFKTGLPYVSPIEFSPTTNEVSLYFSSPVRNASGNIIGVLHICYKAAVIQRLVSQNTDLVRGSASFAILLDENHIRLAHSKAPELNFKSVTPLPPAKVKALQAEGRLPKGKTADFSTNLPAFEQGLDNAATSPYFTTALSSTNNEPNAAAVTKLKTQPWFVVFVQPQSVFLAPIEAQIRDTLLLAAIIAGLVIIAAITIGELLTQPLINLAGTVTQFTAGNLNARTSIKSKDEIGVLALSFNGMAEQVGKLLQGLEERTRELEVSQHVTVAVSELSKAILDPELLLREAIALMQNRFGLHYVQIYLLDQTNSKLVRWADSGSYDILRQDESAYISLECDRSIVAHAARTHQPVWVDDISNLLTEKELQPGQGGSEVAIPLISRGTLLGVLNIQDYQSDRFSQTDLDTFNTLAGQIATAWENARLFEKIQKAEAKYRDKAKELEQTLYELKQTQTQLIQTEKMSSLGQLVAGVAHEINNPVNFIYGNVTPANEYLQDLLQLLDLYQQHYPDPAPEIQTHIEDIELNYLTEDFQKILSSMRVGAERIRQIVLSLRNFSRLDEADMKEVDIHEGIDSTLVILQNQLKNKPGHPEIQVIKEYGELPLVECYAGQINQVFMNLLTNAIDSLDEYNRKRSLEEIKDDPGTIWICTKVVDRNQVEIRIIDNGLGITPEVKQRLFDPFFTTKTVGKGTGLGLAISYQIIVEKHKGNLECISVPGKGAELAIKIPIRV